MDVSGRLVIVIIEDHHKANTLLRIARKRAVALGSRWCAVFIETPSRRLALDQAIRDRMLYLLSTAEQMGGEAVHVQAKTIKAGLASLLEKEAGNVDLVIIGNIKTKSWLGYLNNYLQTFLYWGTTRLASQYAKVENVPLSERYDSLNLAEKYLYGTRPIYLFYALMAVGMAYLCSSLLEWWLPPSRFQFNDLNVTLLFMIACAFAAGRYGLLPGIVASVASIAIVHYSILTPYENPKHFMGTVTSIVDTMLFISAAVLVSIFSSQTRDVAQKATKREMATQSLFTLYRMASEVFSYDQALERLHGKIEQMLEMDVAFFLQSRESSKKIDVIFPGNLALNEEDRKALDECWENLQDNGIATSFNPATNWRFEPMIASAGAIGLFGVRLRKKNHIDRWIGRLIPAIADQTATVLEHIKLEQSMEETRISEEREKLRSMLLSSISHDFKTPIAGVIGALSVIRSLGDRLVKSKREELIEAAIEEAQRLDSFVTNILDMTRLESGNIKFKQEWYDVAELIENTTKRLQHRLRQHELVIMPFTPGTEVYMDAMMTGQVLQNILDNACKYTAAGTKIEISCSVDDDNGFLCEVHDHGKGLPAEKIGHVFDKYARLHKKDMQVAGTGLGLSISKAIIEAQGGWIKASNHPEGGAVFSFSLPKWRTIKVKASEKVSV